MYSLANELSCRDDTHSDSHLVQQDEGTDSSADEVETPHTASFVDPNDPALFVGKHPLSDDEKLTLLTSKFNCPPNFVFPETSGRRFSNWTVDRPWL